MEGISMKKYGDAIEYFDLSECGRNCVYAEREDTALGYNYYCNHEQHNAEVRWGDDRLSCIDADDEPRCGYFEKKEEE
jgi:hypothetical protein